MAIFDNIEKISDTVWESPSTYKDALRSNRGRAFDHRIRFARRCGPGEANRARSVVVPIKFNPGDASGF
jgi:hypothetical protein